MKLRLAPLIELIGVVGVVWLSPPARPLNAGAASDLRNANCPQALVAPRDSAAAVVHAAQRSEPKEEVVGLLSLSQFSLGTDDVWRNIARDRCGAKAAARSWVVFYFRPE